MTTNPTPGTWTQGSNYEVVATDGTNICKVHNDEGQGEANARLIAKVPAMLDALRGLLEPAERRWRALPKTSYEKKAIGAAQAILSRIGGAE